MPFENDPSKNADGTPKTLDPAAQAAADAAAQALAATQDDHTSVFLVAGERAFRDADSVVKNIENAQAHITTLEAERKTDRDTIAARDVEIERLKKIEASVDGRNNSGNDDQTDHMSIEQVAAHAAELAVGKIDQKKTVDVQNANLAVAEAKAKEAYGDGYIDKISEIAESLNLSLKAVDELGKSSPDAFSRLFLPASSGTPHQPTNSSINAPIGDGQQQSLAPVNIVKMREKDRIVTVAAKMKEAGVPGY